jgi:hypothetical protein
MSKPPSDLPPNRRDISLNEVAPLSREMQTTYNADASLTERTPATMSDIGALHILVEALACHVETLANTVARLEREASYRRRDEE